LAPQALTSSSKQLNPQNPVHPVKKYGSSRFVGNITFVFHRENREFAQM